MAWNRGIGNLGSAESTPTNTRPHDTNKEPQTNLVHVHHNKPFTDSLVIADGVGLKHSVVLRRFVNTKMTSTNLEPLVFKTRSQEEKEFLELGQVAFEKRLSTQGSATEKVLK